MDKNLAQVFPQTFPSASCDIYNCRNRAMHFIGRPDAPLNLAMKVCNTCLENILVSVLPTPQPEIPEPEPKAEPKQVVKPKPQKKK